MEISKNLQVAAQCQAVAHLAEVLGELSKTYSVIFEGGLGDDIAEIVGIRTARQLEWLANELNSMDSVTQEDAFIDEILERAQKLWPSDEDYKGCPQ